ncbi:MAG: site-2 protease family protein [Bacillota bacterium]|nr:site-2 protease family protein [Bacillota bacterium]
MKLRLFHINFNISYPMIAAFVILLLIDRSGAIACGCFAAAVHEFGHIFAMILLKSKPDTIKCNFFDITIFDKNRNRRTFKDDLFIVTAGIAVNYILALIFFILYFKFKLPVFFLLFSSNLFIGIFNSLPVEALDGGQILYILLTRAVQPKTAVKIIEIISFVVLLPMALLGFLLLLHSKNNYSLLIISCYLMFILLMKKSKFF